MATVRSTQMVVAYNPQGKKQAAIGTAMPASSLTAALSAVSKEWPEVVETTEDIMNCTAEDIRDRKVTARYGRIRIEINASIRDLTIFLAYHFGSVLAPVVAVLLYLHQLLRLPFGIYQPPMFSLIFGFAESDATPALVRDCVVDDIEISIGAKRKVTFTVNLKFNGDIQDAPEDYVLPSCDDQPVIWGTDCALTLGGVDVSEITKEVTFTSSNGILVDDDPFVLNSIDIKRLERANVRTAMFNINLEGQAGDANWANMVARTKLALALRIGPAAGEKVVLNAPHTEISRNGSGKGYDGQAGRSMLRMNAEPFTNGTATSPVSAQATTSQETAYLVAAA